MIACIALIIVFSVPRAPAAFEVYQGDGMMCMRLVSELQRDWMDVRRHLVPITGHLDRAKDEDFVCVSNRAILQSREVTGAGMSTLKCFKPDFYRGGGFCCDERLQSCAALNPGLFPDIDNKPTRKASEPQKSIWVKPPSDDDQWQSN